MPRKLLLLADDRCWHELRCSSGLPEWMWVDRGSELQESSFTEREESIIRHDPALVAIDHGPALRGSRTTADDSSRSDHNEVRSELFAELLGSLVCRLVLLETTGDRVDSAADQASTHATVNLASLVEWYKKLHEEFRRRVAHRHDDSRHILILICTDPLKAEELDYLRALTEGEEQDRLCDVCYVMWHQLELGEHSVCHARHVWPLAVARLLLRLLEDSPPQRTARTRTHAWRAFELAPGVDQEVVDGVLNSMLVQVYAELKRRIHSEKLKWNSQNFNPLPTIVDPVPLTGEKPIHWGEYWHSFRAEHELRRVTAADRWERELVAAGRQFGNRLAQHAILDDPPAWSEVHKAWSEVHKEPGNVAVALSDPNLSGATQLTDRFQEIAGSWAEIAQAEQLRRTKIGEAEQCAEILRDAQAGFLEKLFRFAAVALVTLLIAYVAMVFCYERLGSLFTGVGVGLGAAVGALLTVFGIYFWERYCGERAHGTFVGMLKEIDELTKTSHERCQRAINRAAHFWGRLRSSSAASRLRMLLLRVQAMLDRELQPELPVAGAVESDDSPVSDESDAKSDQRRRRQRRKFLEVTSLRHKVDFHDLEVQRLRAMPAIDRLIRELQNTFITEVWARACADWDRAQAGNIPARQLIPRIRDFRDRLRSELVAALHHQLIEQMHQRGADSWALEISRFHNEALYYFLSCPVENVGMAEIHKRTRLFIRSDFPSDALAQQLDLKGTDASDRIRRLPIVGLLFQECPVQFVRAGEFIKVQHHVA